MPQHAKNPQHRFYFYPVEPPETVLSWETWPTYQVCIPGPLIPYLLNVMRVYQWVGRVKTDYEDEAKAFVEAWSDLIARVGASVECDPMPYPIFRMNPLNGCQTQQSLDNGETWVTILDTSACQPTMPIFRPHPTVPGSMQQSTDDGETWTTVLNPVTIPPMVQFRQNSTNPALLEQSLNGGSSWTTAYDYSKYRPQSVIQENVLYNQTTEIVNNYIQTWNNNPTVNEFAPQMVYDSGSTPANDQRDAAICYAISAWYDIAKQAAVAYVANQNDGLAAFSSSVVGAGVSMVGTPVAGILAAAVVGALVKGISLLGAATQESNYAAAKNDIVCCMYEGLQGATLTRERFQASLSGCGFTGGSNSEAIRAVIHALVQDLDVYVTFLKAAAEWFNYAEFSELPDCLCDEEEPPAPIWRIVPGAPYNNGVIVSETETTLTATAQSNTDNIYRLVVERLDGKCVDPSAFSVSSGTAAYPAYRNCANTLISGVITSAINFRQISYASNVPFSVTVTYAVIP